MACYCPVTLYKSRMGRNPVTGKWPLVSASAGYLDKPEKVPCGRCTGCRLERSRQWAIRCVHESQMHEDNSFLTLTYTDENLVYGKERATLVPRDLTLFFKRLRNEYGKGIRYFACGEYGSRTGRPHYHACIFGLDFKDKTVCNIKNANLLYHSNNLDSIWRHGYCTIGSVTFESAAYVARYIMDKRLGETSVYYDEQKIEPEFVRMSRRPGLGSSWYEKYKSDVFPHDFVVIRDGVKCTPPKFYSSKFELDNEELMSYIKDKRKDKAAMKWKDNTVDRLAVREEVKNAQIATLVREI